MNQQASRVKMSKIVDRKRYNTETAVLIADDVYWDGNNFDRSGRNTWLYKTKGGAYFSVTTSMWQGERDTLEPLSMDEAIELYEGGLSEHYAKYEEAFPVVVAEASAGRPTYYGQTMKQTAVWLPDEMITWLKAQPGTMGEAIRDLIKKAMQ